MFQTLQLRSGSVLGGVLLLSGSCIGVGMLALPILTGFAGFIPTTFMFIVCWLFMTTTALLFLEANLWYPKHNIVSLSERTLGVGGKAIAWITFLFLFYSLLVAYISKGGELVQHALARYFSSDLPVWSGPVLLTLVSAVFVYFGTWIVDRFNRLCMVGLFVTYVFLMCYGFEHTDYKLLSHVDWHYCLFIVPFIITSFGVHNMIPTICEYLHGNRQKLVATILIGGLVPFFIYLLWIIKVQTILPLNGEISITTSYQKEEISTEPLAQLIQNPWIGLTAQYFAFFAIITSLLAQALSMVDFLADGFKIPRTIYGRLFLCILAFVPPFVLAYTVPDIFFMALEFAGGIAAVILFGILPALIVWIGRYWLQVSASPIVPGGKWTLVAVMAFALFVLSFEILKHLGVVQLAPTVAN